MAASQPMTFLDYRVAYFAQKCGSGSALHLRLPSPCADSFKQQNPMRIPPMGQREDQACPAILGYGNSWDKCNRM